MIERSRVAAARLARVGGALPPGAASRARLFRNPALAATYRRIVEEAGGGEPRGRDRPRARRFLPGFRRRRDRPLLPRERRPADGRRPRRAGRRRSSRRSPSTTTGTRSARPGRGVRARSCCSSSPCSPGSTSPAIGVGSAELRPHDRRVREARVRRPRGVLRRSELRRRPARPPALARRTATSVAGSSASRPRVSCGRAADGCRTSVEAEPSRRRRRAHARRHRPPRRGRPLRQPRVGHAERRLAPELAGDPVARMAARHAGADVLARGRAARVARAGQAAPHDALADARAPRGRAVPGVRDARRRPAGPVVAARLPRAMSTEGSTSRQPIDAPEFHTDHFPSVVLSAAGGAALARRSRIGSAATCSTSFERAGTTFTAAGDWSLGRVSAVGREPTGR